ncbi:type II toxin-antitoxin system prevent-host-death family antitoxin [Streptomyces sp. CB01881]|uniref:type II toxin-antitoxin system Phd/YefM family antitoxin n=1 Tax=Streptomyces sp. CB01881 TaxID=2078691 RepID=UPI000CDCCC05|nr:type II toxin-antitoxin system prevent-host-death family antitoxin [Streptomyces sp. CB01881]AUY54201.1 prevent-host-death family protein [Streptomyces sp. CB01881]TYC73152.1 type II toxin-antitoxin system prevent-host-death family antitoxin [Streptomyces sp. CB01881]
MTATEASRSFAAVLDSAEHGETIVVTRGGRRIAVIGPAPTGNGAAINDVLRSFRADDTFAADVSSARTLLKDKVTEWPGD